MNNLADPTKLVMTIGVSELMRDGKDNLATEIGNQILLQELVKKAFDKEPDVRTNGDTDKDFFLVYFPDEKGTKLFVARNEIDGLTVMRPEEY